MFTQTQGRSISNFEIATTNEVVDFKLANKGILAARINKVGEKVWIKNGSMVAYTVLFLFFHYHRSVVFINGCIVG